MADVLPAIALVFAAEQVAGGAAESECSAIGIDVEPVANHDVCTEDPRERQAAERASTWYGVSAGVRQFASGTSTVVTSAY